MRRHHVIFFLHTDNLMVVFAMVHSANFNPKNAEYKPAGRAFCMVLAIHATNAKDIRAGLYMMYIRIITVYIYGNRQNLRSAAR